MPETVKSIANAVVDALTIRSQIPSDSELVAFDPIRPEPGYIYLPFRADLVRQSEKTGTDTQKIGPVKLESDKTESAEYSVPGLRLGNGLFVDSNRNLCLDFGEVTGFSRMENCTLTFSDGSLVGGKTVIRKRGSAVTITQGTVMKSSTGVTVEEKETTIDRGFFPFDDTIRADVNEVEFKPGGLFGFFSKVRIVGNGQSFRIPGFLWDDQFASVEDGGVLRVLSSTSAGGFTIANEGKRIRVTEPGCTYYFVKTGKKIVFYDETRINGFAIDIEGNRFVYAQKGFGESVSLSMTIEKN